MRSGAEAGIVVELARDLAQVLGEFLDDSVGLVRCGDAADHLAIVLDDAVDVALDSGSNHIAVDLQPTGFMDSTGLRSLFSAHRRLSDGGRLIVIPGTGPVRRLLEVAGVESALEIVDSPDDLPHL